MSSIIKFQVISGAYDEAPLSYLFQVDEYRFLLDCGWDENFSQELEDEYKKIVRTVDAVLITYPDLQHIGALPYLVGKCGLNCPIYTTVPVNKMGHMFMYDICLGKSNCENFTLFNLNDIDTAFDKVEQLKYSQTVNLTGKGLGLQLTPLPAGHMIGGTIWRILKEGEEEFIYAVDYNHHKECHLNTCVLDAISKPTLLITDAYNVLNQKKKSRDEKLLIENILKTCRNSGNVLICTDTAGRVLELAYLLDQSWRKENSGLLAYPIVLLNNVSISVADFAKSQVEWMNDKLVRQFEEGRNNPFQLKHVQLCNSLVDFDLIQSPKVVLASTPDLECGFSRDLFLDWCEDEKNLAVFTIKTSKGTLARRLIDFPEERVIKIDLKRKVKLEGAELDEYYRELILKEAKEEKLSKDLESIDMGSSSSDEESERPLSGDRNVSAKHDLMKKQENKKTGFFKHNRKTYPMFPYKEETIKWDDYGQIKKNDEFFRHSEAAKKEQANQMETDQAEDDIKAEPVQEVPSKWISESRILNVRAKTIYFDFEGRSDGESMKKIIEKIRPKNLIIIHGNERATNEMADYFKKSQIERIFTPKYGEVIDATNETQIYQVKLKDNIVSALKFQKCKEYELAWIDGIIKANQLEENQVAPLPNLLTSSLEELSLYPIPKEQLALLKRKVVFVNEPKLSDLKLLLVKKGFQAEFHGGVLVCNGLIALRKEETGRITLEGVVSDDYYRVRQILYDEYAII